LKKKRASFGRKGGEHRGKEKIQKRGKTDRQNKKLEKKRALQYKNKNPAGNELNSQKGKPWSISAAEKDGRGGEGKNREGPNCGDPTGKGGFGLPANGSNRLELRGTSTGKAIANVFKTARLGLQDKGEVPEGGKDLPSQTILGMVPSRLDGCETNKRSLRPGWKGGDK